MRMILVLLGAALVLPGCGPDRGSDSTLNNAALKAANAARAKKIAEQDAIEEARQLKFMKAHSHDSPTGAASEAQKKHQDGRPPP
jgi:hypothetical protein